MLISDISAFFNGDRRLIRPHNHAVKTKHARREHPKRCACAQEKFPCAHGLWCLLNVG